MKKLLAVLLLCWGASASAGDYSLKVREVEVTWQKIINKKSPLLMDIPSPDWGDHVSLAPKMDFLKRGFFNSEWYFDTAYKKVTEAGLHFDLGVRVFTWAELVYRHWSYHSADRFNSFGSGDQFGLEDYVGLRLRFTP